MNHNDFREIIDDAPETGADTNTGAAGGTQPGSGAPMQKMRWSMRAHQAPER